jgi:hypothetical protein
MTVISLTLKFALALLLSAGALFALSTSAEAAGGVAPSCVKRQVGSTGGVPDGARVRVTNRCSRTVHVKIVFSHAHDSACLTVRRSHSRTAQSNIAYPFSHYDKTVTC